MVTGDALLTQRAICERIVANGGDYLFPVDENQPSLRSESWWATWRSRRLPDTTRGTRGDVDWLGAALLAITITVVAIALNHPHGTTTSDVMPVFHVVLPVIALATAALFVLLERRRSEPLMDWRQLHHGGTGHDHDTADDVVREPWMGFERQAAGQQQSVRIG